MVLQFSYLTNYITAQQSESAQGELVSGTSGIGYKRPSPTYNTFQQDQSAKKKPKKSNYENEGNVPKRLQESDESGTIKISKNSHDHDAFYTDFHDFFYRFWNLKFYDIF